MVILSVYITSFFTSSQTTSISLSLLLYFCKSLNLHLMLFVLNHRLPHRHFRLIIFFCLFIPNRLPSRQPLRELLIPSQHPLIRRVYPYTVTHTDYSLSGLPVFFTTTCQIYDENLPNALKTCQTFQNWDFSHMCTYKSEILYRLCKF